MFLFMTENILEFMFEQLNGRLENSFTYNCNVHLYVQNVINIKGIISIISTKTLNPIRIVTLLYFVHPKSKIKI